MCPRTWIAGLMPPALLALTGCGQSGPPVAELPPPVVSVSQPVEKEVVDEDFYDGRIAAINNVKVRPQVSGYLTKVLFQDGQEVKEGDPLFEIDPRPYKATLDAYKADKASAEATLALARAEYARIARLLQSGAATREELDVWTAKQGTATADRQRAEANIEKAQLDLDFCNIRAPVAGRVSRPLLTVGNLVGSAGDNVLTTILSTDPIYVYFPVDERSLMRYRKDLRKAKELADLKQLQIPVQVALEGEQGYPHKAVVDFADNRVNAATGTIQARAVLRNPDGLMSDGLRARVRVPVSDPYPALLIAERAVGSDQSNKYVFVVGSDDLAERRDVVLGRNFGGLIAVKSGLKPKEWIVVNGIQRVRDGLKVKPKQVPMPGSASDSGK